MTGENFKEFIVDVFGIPFIQPPMYGPLWFVRELVVLFLLYPMISLCVRRFPVVGLCFFFAVIICSDMTALYDSGYYLKSSVLFFALGLFYGFRQNNDAKDKLAILCARKDVAVGTMLIAVVLSYVYQTYDGNNMGGHFLKYLAILLFFPVIFRFAKYIENVNGGLTKLFLTISEFSFMVYVLHGKLLSIIQIVCTRVIQQNSVILLAEYILLPIVVIVTVIFISHLLRKKMPGVYLFLTGGR